MHHFFKLKNKKENKLMGEKCHCNGHDLFSMKGKGNN